MGLQQIERGAQRFLLLATFLAACCRPAPSNTAAEGPPLSIPDLPIASLDRAAASRFAKLSLACLDREYPNKPDAVLDGDDGLKAPRLNTPAFYGCFDWHSAVHGHWALVRVLGLFPDLPEAPAIRAALDRHLTAANLEAELRFFQRPSNGLLERPYGWGWLLRLAAELHTSPLKEARTWEGAVRPLAVFLAGQLVDYTGRLSAPIRQGTHPNTAFALVHALDYARALGDGPLAAALEQRALQFYGDDRACPVAYEPSGEDFISPCLAEADLMRRVLSRERFVAWLDGFLPALSSPAFAPLLHPLKAKDPKDPRIGHLIGLAMQRAWCMNGIAAALPETDPRREPLSRLGRVHRQEAFQAMADSGYGGEHWLASFAIYLLSTESKSP